MPYNANNSMNSDNNGPVTDNNEEFESTNTTNDVEVPSADSSDAASTTNVNNSASEKATTNGSRTWGKFNSIGLFTKKSAVPADLLNKTFVVKVKLTEKGPTIEGISNETACTGEFDKNMQQFLTNAASQKKIGGSRKSRKNRKSRRNSNKKRRATRRQ